MATDPVAGCAEALGFGGTARVLPLVRAVASGLGGLRLPAGPAEPCSVDAAAGVLGAAWLRLVEARLEIARSAGPWWALDGLGIVSERPLVFHRDDRGRPHCADGRALAWAHGLEAFAWYGVPIEPWVIRDPGRITVAAIDGERNIELRRALTERFGEERLVREGGAELVARRVRRSPGPSGSGRWSTGQRQRREPARRFFDLAGVVSPGRRGAEALTVEAGQDLKLRPPHNTPETGSQPPC